MQGNLNPFDQISISTINALPRPPFGKSYHNSILLIPAYKQKLMQGAPLTRSIKKWSDEADTKLQDCFAYGIHPMALRSVPPQ
jgi:hypothetical protein